MTHDSVSAIIPLELLPVISFHLVQTPKPSPILYDIPQSYLLDRVTSCAYPTQASPPIRKPVPRMVSVDASPLPQSLVWNRAAVAQALQVAMNTGLRDTSTVLSLPRPRTCSEPSRNSTDSDRDGKERYVPRHDLDASL
jgi:hypothetical protein